jgi:serine/threonine protein kinase
VQGDCVAFCVWPRWGVLRRKMVHRAVAGGAVGGELLAGAGGVGASFVVGSRVAGYRLEGKVGAGGMAVVFRARDELLGRPVALKIMAPALAADEVFRQRFIREWRAAAAVDDPHIIPVYEAGEADGVLFLSMRLVADGDVRSLVQREGPLPPAQAAAIISPVASALDAAHGAGLVHRDVKAANMLLDRRPGRPAHVYLSDFGLSKSALSSAGLTAAGHFLGTPNYMAPEQIQGLPADGRTDQYALACVAFELLTGAPPFQRDQGVAVVWAHLREPPPMLSSRRPGLRTAADQVLVTALAKTPQDRYASCGDFAEALRAALGLTPYRLQPDAAPAPAPGTAWSDGPQPANTAVPAAAAATGTTDPHPTTAARAADIAAPPAINSRRMAPGPAPASHTRRRSSPRRRRTLAALTGLCLALLSAAAIVLSGALQANSVAGFNRRVGWATTVLAVLIAAVGVLLLVDKIAGNAALPELSAAEAEDELAAVVLNQAEVQRSRLIGIEEASDEAANVRFAKRTGTFRSAGGPGEGNLASVSGYYQSLSPKRLVVLGDPGAGKTVLALELLIQLLERRRIDRDTPIPVLVSAAACDTNVPWDKWLIRYLAQRFSMATNVMGNLVRDGRILPIVDGLDEMDPPGAPQRANALIAALNSYMRGRERAAIVVTCRRAEYQVLTRKVDRATHVEMVPLTSHEAAAYLSKEFLSEMERNSWEPVLADLRDNPKGLLASQLTTPWRLTLALAVFRANGDPAELLPGPVHTLSGPAAVRYARRVDALLLGRYIRAKVNLNGRDLGYTPQKVERWLTALAHGLDWQGHNNGSATDIHLDQWWRPAGPRMVQLAHVAVVAIIALPWAAFAAMRGQPGLIVIGATILPLAAFAAHSPKSHRLQTGQLSTRVGFLRLLLRLTAGLAAGLALGLTGRFASGLAAGLTLLLALGFTSGLVIGVEDHSPHAIGPRDVIQADRNFGLAAGLAFGLGGGLAGGLAGALARWLAARLGVGMLVEPGGLALGLAEGFALGLAFGLAFGGASSVRYYLGVVGGAFRGTRPMAFGTFLDWCCHAGLLRVSGITYQFRHRQLQDWLMSSQ